MNYFSNNGPSEQWAFVFSITGCQKNGLSVQWGIFRTTGLLEEWAIRTMGSPQREQVEISKDAFKEKQNVS